MLISAVWLALQLPVDKPTTCCIIPQFWCNELNSHGILMEAEIKNVAPLRKKNAHTLKDSQSSTDQI